MVTLVAQFLAVLLAVIAVSKSYVDFKAGKESLQIFLFWLLTWSAVVFVALFRTVLDVMITQFGDGRTGLGCRP
jgi:hypothetical protein